MFNRIIYKFVLHIRHNVDADIAFKTNIRRAILAVQSILLSLVISILLLGIDITVQNHPAIVVDLCFMLSCIFSLWLIFNGYISISKLLLFLSAIISVTLNASKEGPFVGNQYIWIIVLVGVFALFSNKEFNYRLFALIAIIFTLIFCEYTDYSYFKSEFITIERMRFNQTTLLIICVLMIWFLLFYMTKNSQLIFKDKDKINKKLQKRTEFLKTVNQESDKFAYQASHDVRAPLTSMLGLIALGKNETDIDKLHHLLNLQEKTIVKLDKYVNEILTLTRNKRTAVEIERIDFELMLNNIEEQYQFMINECPIPTFFEKIIDQQLTFYTDAKRLNTILTNIIANSIRYADIKKNKLQISCTVKALNYSLIEIVVLDNGIGISKEELPKVTDMFYHSQTKNMATGLGLHIVKEMIFKLGGTLEITSEFGVYTQSKIILPSIISN